MSGSNRGLTGGDVFLLYCLWTAIVVSLMVIKYDTGERFDALDAACGVEQVEEG